MLMNVIDEAMDRLLFGLGGLKALTGFYLAGGTALALQSGHRKSVDLDLFREEEWSVEVATTALAGLGGVEVELADWGSLWARVDDVRVSLLHYPYRLVGELVPGSWGLPPASLLDIACMKLVAVSRRGSRKDFVNLYFLARTDVAPRDALVALAEKAGGSRSTPYISRGALHTSRTPKRNLIRRCSRRTTGPRSDDSFYLKRGTSCADQALETSESATSSIATPVPPRV